MKEKLPNFLIVGSAKAGTTSLYYYLKEHPEVFLSEVKEPHFFSKSSKNLPFKGPKDETFGSTKLMNINWNDYKSLFNKVENETAIGEASADYLYYHKNTTDEIKKYLENFHFLGYLERSILDIKNFSNKKKLPLINDILKKAYSFKFKEDIDYIIYTNVDIALMPYFYEFIYYKIINEKIDSLIVNRRTISNKYTSIDELPLMYSEIGQKHPGYDCFVFPFNLIKDFKLGEVIIGTHGIGKILLTNIYLYSNNFCLERDKHLTFHIGDDKNWKSKQYNEFQLHNIKEVNNIIHQNFLEKIKKDDFLFNLNKGILNYENNIIKKFIKSLFK